MALVHAAVLAVAPAAHGAIPIQPDAGPFAGCTPPGNGACVGTPGKWFGTAGDDTVQVWVGGDGASIDSVRVVVNTGNCTVSSRTVLVRRYSPPRIIFGGGLPECRVVETLPCVAPAVRGFQLEIRFPTSSCALVELWFRDPAGRGFCPTPCPALDDIGVAVLGSQWSAVKRLYQ